MKSIIALCILLSIFAQQSYAYLDPGTGSMLLSGLVAVFATLFFIVKNLYYKCLVFFAGLLGSRIKYKHLSLVIYSEGNTYWTTFQPILQELEKRKINTIFLTSSIDDPVFKENYCYINSQYIGMGNKAYATLNFLEADILVSTTPGLDVLQIKRSKGVKNYIYIMHSFVGIGKYQLYSFDYFDYILCSGQYQIDQLRMLENVRGTKPKTLLKSGCSYADILIERLKKNTVTENQKPIILIAPTWGNNSLFNYISEEDILRIVHLDCEIIIRPHPQMKIATPEILDKFQSLLKDYSNIRWDFSHDNFLSLYQCDLLISDLSGIIYDAVFVFEKPIIALYDEININGIEQYDLPQPIWDLKFFADMGTLIHINEVASLPGIIEKNLDSSSLSESKIRFFKKEGFYNEGQSSSKIVQQLINIQENLKEQNA